MNWKIATFEVFVILSLIWFYIIPNWEKKQLSLSDVIVAELLYFIAFDMYKHIKRKI